MRLLVPVLAASLGLCAQAPRPTEVQERRLPNGARLLLVERRGLEAVQATLVFRGGWAEEPPALAGAMELLARSLYGGTWPEDLEAGPAASALEALLQEEESLAEALRQERARVRREPGESSRAPGLEARLASLRTGLEGRFSRAPLSDRYRAQGMQQTARATADALLVQTELPAEALALWCRTEAQRLTVLQLSRFSAAREGQAADLRTRGPQGPALLRGAALPGHPYGRDLADHLPSLEALRRSDLRAYARRALDPSRLTIILVGSLDLKAVLPLLERSLGALPQGPESADPLMPEITAGLGDRRLQAPLGDTARLLVGWRIPARPHRDHLALRVAARLLGGSPGSRLASRLVEQKGLARRASARLDEPGGRLPGLLVADLVPAEGHALPELEGALHTEILRLQQEPIPLEEWQRTLSQLEADHLRRQDDPEALASGLAEAWAEGGDWRLFDQEAQRLRALGPEAVQSAARTWLKPSHRTTASLQPGTEEGQDPLEAETARVLRALAATRIEDLAQREQLVSEGLRQLRMLSAEERRRTLKLLESQLIPERR